jgi:arginine exporter protein ArgO
MSILNYFFIGIGFIFFIDLLFNIKQIKNHPKMKNTSWGWFERLLAVIIWPIAVTIFMISFLKTYFKK